MNASDSAHVNINYVNSIQQVLIRWNYLFLVGGTLKETSSTNVFNFLWEVKLVKEISMLKLTEKIDILETSAKL